MPENIPGEPFVPNEQHQGAGPNFETLRAFSNDGPDDVEIFKEIPEVSLKIVTMAHLCGNQLENIILANNF